MIRSFMTAMPSVWWGTTGSAAAGWDRVTSLKRKKDRQLRSRIAQTLDVPKTVRLAFSLAAALLAAFLSAL